MKPIVSINSVSDYNALAGQPTWHPLVSVLDFSASPPTRHPEAASFNLGLYAVFLKQDQHCDIRYGRNHYDYQEGTLVFMAPGQVVGMDERPDEYQPSGHALLFHPDLLRGTALGQHMKEYGFFTYAVHEALHLSAQEQEIVLECFRKIDYELRHALDKHSKRLIVSNIELFLNYCVRFYDRQFLTRDQVNTSVLEKFEHLLEVYFQSDAPQLSGLPSVAFVADKLHLSANYFGDLVKRETGKTAQEYIQLKLIAVAKEKIFDPGKSINEVAYELGFKYPQHFTRFFKQHVGASPNEYRRSLN